MDVVELVVILSDAMVVVVLLSSLFEWSEHRVPSMLVIR